MKNKKCLIIIIFMIFLTACSKKEYVVFKYNCQNISDYKCELKNSKLNCDVKYPTCEGYEFLGWYDSKENGNEVNLYSKFKDKDIIYVHWKEKEEPSIEEESSLVEVSSYIEEPSSIIEESSSQKTYIITFDLNGGLGSVSPQDVEKGGTLPTIGSIPTRIGYTFMGWYDNQDYTKGTQYYNASNVRVRLFDKESNITLYAHWKANTYTISFNANGGSGNSSTKNVTYDGILPTIGSVPTREGYTFLGWYDNQDYTKGTQYYNERNVPVVKKYIKTLNITLYAHWKENIYTITFNPNGGTGSMTSQSFYGNVSQTIKVNTYKRTGYIFNGWNTKPNGTGTSYKDRESVVFRNDTTLYAQWIENLKIYFISDYRTDSFLIIGNGTTLFIDGGEESEGLDSLEFLKKMGIKKIDGLIGSHFDNNHVDAHKVYIKTLEVKHVYYPVNPNKCIDDKTCTGNHTELINLIKNKNIPVTVLTPKDDVKIGNLVFDIIGPLSLERSGEYRNNHNSLNMILKFGNNKFYFSGDGIEEEEILAKYSVDKIKSDVFKYPHHGKYGLSANFLRAVSPKYVIVTHHENTLNQTATGVFNDLKSQIFVVGNKGIGTVFMESDGKNIVVKTKFTP